MFAGFTSVMVTPSCRSLDAATAPAEVVHLTVTRGTALASLEASLATLDDVAVADAIAEDSAAWSYIQGAQGFVTPAALKGAAQSQKIATEVAAAKIRRGEYTDAQKLELVQALRVAWDGLSTYYNPEQ